MSACIVCRTPIPELARPAGGRPPSYCSEVCRRERNHELRRLDRELQRIAAKLADANVEVQMSGGPMVASRRQKGAVAGWEREQERATRRLHELLAATPEEVTSVA